MVKIQMSYWLNVQILFSFPFLFPLSLFLSNVWFSFRLCILIFSFLSMEFSLFYFFFLSRLSFRTYPVGDLNLLNYESYNHELFSLYAICRFLLSFLFITAAHKHIFCVKIIRYSFFFLETKPTYLSWQS